MSGRCRKSLYGHTLVIHMYGSAGEKSANFELAFDFIHSLSENVFGGSGSSSAGYNSRSLCVVVRPVCLASQNCRCSSAAANFAKSNASRDLLDVSCKAQQQRFPKSKQQYEDETEYCRGEQRIERNRHLHHLHHHDKKGRVQKRRMVVVVVEEINVGVCSDLVELFRTVH